MLNNKSQQKPSWIVISLSYVFASISALILYGYVYPSSQLILEIPPVMSVLDSQLYKNDIFVQSNSSFTPRYYYQKLIYLATHLGFNLSLSHFIYYSLAFVSFVLGLYALGRKFGRSQLTGAILVFLALNSVGGTVGYVSIFRPEPIPAVLAMGLVVWGFYFCFSKQWFLGYLFFGLTSLVHILVGLLAGLLMIPVLLIETARNRNLTTLIAAFLIFGILIGLVYVPMAISGATSTSELSNREFVYLYGYIRAPHHFIPSEFAPQTWRSFLCFTLGGLLLIFYSDTLNSDAKKSFTIIIFTSFFALFIGYLLVEIYPLATITKLQFARTTPFVNIIVLIAISVLINEHYRKGNIGLCILLLVTPIVKNGAIILFILAVGLTILKITNRQQLLRNRPLNAISVVASIIFLCFYPLPSSPQEAGNRLFWKLTLLLILTFPFFVEKFWRYTQIIKIAVPTLALGSISFLLLGLYKILPSDLSNFFQARISMLEQPKLTDSLDSITRIALRFKARSHQDAVILIPPSLSQFRLYSQRAVVVDLRSFPFTDAAIGEWRDRMIAVLGPLQPGLSWRSVDSFYRQRNSANLVEAAEKFQANYILTRTDWHPDIPGKIELQEGEWVIYNINGKNN